MLLEEVKSYNSRAKRIAAVISGEIQAGKYPPGEMLPTEEKLADVHHVTRMTIRKSLQILSDGGLVIRVPRRGTVVAEPERKESTSSGNRAHRTKRKVSLVAIGCSPMDYGATTRLQGIKQYAKEHQLRFATCVTKHHSEAIHALEQIDRFDADGVMLLLPLNDDSYHSVLSRIVQKGIPLVSTNQTSQDIPLSTVMSDDRQGAYEGTHYLIQKYRQPVYYLGEMKGHELSPERREGYQAAMRDAGLAEHIQTHIQWLEMYDFTPYWQNEEYWKPGYLQAQKLFDRISFPASLMCLTDFVAQGVYKAAEERNLVIGKDVFVVGFDGCLLGEFLKPTLTTVRNYAVELGVETGKLLHHLVEEPTQAPVHIRLPMELIVRQSA